MWIKKDFIRLNNLISFSSNVKSGAEVKPPVQYQKEFSYVILFNNTFLGCLDAILRYNETKAELNNVAFNDEDAYVALSEALDEDLAELYERCIISED